MDDGEWRETVPAIRDSLFCILVFSGTQCLCGEEPVGNFRARYPRIQLRRLPEFGLLEA
jgi:hypothetical protein